MQHSNRKTSEKIGELNPGVFLFHGTGISSSLFYPSPPLFLRNIHAPIPAPTPIAIPTTLQAPFYQKAQGANSKVEDKKYIYHWRQFHPDLHEAWNAPERTRHLRGGGLDGRA